MSEKLLYNRGINDVDYKISRVENYKQVWLCPYYVRWRGMLRRCYDPKSLATQPWYSECSVREDWFLLSNFKRWCESQEILYGRNITDMELDKDFLMADNKVYSEDTCVLVPKLVNLFVVDRSKQRGNTLTGAAYIKKSGRWRSRVKNTFTGQEEHLGMFDSEIAAHEAWKLRKAELAEEVILTGCIDYDERLKVSLRERYNKSVEWVKNCTQDNPYKTS